MILEIYMENTTCLGKTLRGSRCQITFDLINGYCKHHIRQCFNTPTALATPPPPPPPTPTVIPSTPLPTSLPTSTPATPSTHSAHSAHSTHPTSTSNQRYCMNNLCRETNILQNGYCRQHQPVNISNIEELFRITIQKIELLSNSVESLASRLESIEKKLADII